jgi:transposase-like protein
MNVESTFEAEKNLTLIARKAALQKWSDHRPIRKLVCPHCESDRVNRRMQSRDGCEYICHDCRQNLSEEDFPKCCPYLGKYLKCQACFYFQAFAKAVKEEVKKLRCLTPEERAAIVAAPGFYQPEQSKQPSQKPIPQAEKFSALASDWSDISQLSLFEDAVEPQLDGENPE